MLVRSTVAPIVALEKNKNISPILIKTFQIINMRKEKAAAIQGDSAQRTAAKGR